MPEPASNSGKSHCCKFKLARSIFLTQTRRQTISSDQTRGGMEWGYALPGEPTGNNDEYIGYIVSYTEWCPVGIV
jgi:hypothetical protein